MERTHVRCYEVEGENIPNPDSRIKPPNPVLVGRVSPLRAAIAGNGPWRAQSDAPYLQVQGGWPLAE